MPKTVTKYSIFLGSPNDLGDEREEIKKTIDELNANFGVDNNIVFELLRWETHAASGIADGSVQNLIDSDIGNDYDIFLGVIWKRFGTQTDKADSGTEQEFLNAFKRYQEDKSVQVLFYFKTQIGSLKDINNIDEYSKVIKFKESLKEKNINYGEFEETKELLRQIRKDIPIRIKSQLKNTNEYSKSQSENQNSSEEELGYLDFIENFEAYIALSLQGISIFSDATEWIGKEMTKKAEVLNRLKRTSNPPNQTVVKQIMKLTGDIMESYAEKLKSAIPQYYKNFELAIENGIKMIEISDDFENENYEVEIKEAKDSVIQMRYQMTDAKESVQSMYNSIADLPNISKYVISGKKKVLTQLEKLIDDLRKTLELSEEYTKAVNKKIDEIEIRRKNN